MLDHPAGNGSWCRKWCALSPVLITACLCSRRLGSTQESATKNAPEGPSDCDLHGRTMGCIEHFWNALASPEGLSRDEGAKWWMEKDESEGPRSAKFGRSDDLTIGRCGKGNVAVSAYFLARLTSRTTPTTSQHKVSQDAGPCPL